jgi:uncharacterized tellurite resistance protein B-like protein
MSAQNITHIKNLVALAQVDGHIDEQEIDLLHELAGELGINEAEVNHWLEYAEEIVLSIPVSMQERERHLINMITLSNADGHFSNAEFEFCQLMADKLPYSGLGEALSKRMNATYLKNLIALASADGKIDESELNIIREAAENIGIGEDELAEWIEDSPNYTYFIPEDYEDRETQLIQMLTLAIADGEFSEDEYNMCKSVAEKLDFTERELQLIIKLSFKGEILF